MLLERDGSLSLIRCPIYTRHSNSKPHAKTQAATAANETCAPDGFAGRVHFLQAELAFDGESAAAFSLTKRKRLKDSLALLLEVDSSQVRWLFVID
jgi:hypothetical protein